MERKTESKEFLKARVYGLPAIVEGSDSWFCFVFLNLRAAT